MSERSTNAELAAIQHEILIMLVDQKPNREIYDHLKTKYGKSDTVTRRYIAEALKTLSEWRVNDIEGHRVASQQHLLAKYNEMLEDYAQNGRNPKYMQLAIAFYDRYLKLFPNGLEPEVEDAEKILNITFTKGE